MTVNRRGQIQLGHSEWISSLVINGVAMNDVIITGAFVALWQAVVCEGRPLDEFVIARVKVELVHIGLAVCTVPVHRLEASDRFGVFSPATILITWVQMSVHLDDCRLAEAHDSCVVAVACKKKRCHYLYVT